VSDSVLLKSGSEMVYNKENKYNLTSSYSTSDAEQREKMFFGRKEMELHWQSIEKIVQILLHHLSLQSGFLQNGDKQITIV
jgi:hypothetical protein